MTRACRGDATPCLLERCLLPAFDSVIGSIARAVSERLVCTSLQQKIGGCGSQLASVGEGIGGSGIAQHVERSSAERVGGIDVYPFTQQRGHPFQVTENGGGVKRRELYKVAEGQGSSARRHTVLSHQPRPRKPHRPHPRRQFAQPGAAP